MASMDYCKFENTNNDLERCIKSLEERDISSDIEKEYAISLLKSVCEFLQVEGIIEEYDSEKIDRIIEECKDQYE